MFHTTPQAEATPSYIQPVFELEKSGWRIDHLKQSFKELGERCAIYAPKNVPCEVTDYIFKGNHGEEWPVTRLGVGEYKIEVLAERVKGLFRITSQTVASGARAGAVPNDNPSQTRLYDSVDFLGKSDVVNRDGLQKDGTIVQTRAEPSLGNVEVLFRNEFAYLRVPGRLWGHWYYKTDINTLNTFFAPIRLEQSPQPPAKLYAFPRKAAAPSR